jgi:ubiquinone/menaquinone biosynthesis C-methylase UbiE
MIFKVSNYVEDYRVKAKYAKDLGELAGRGARRRATEVINERIYAGLCVKQKDQLVDIGCGDGTLLRLAKANGLTQAVGLSGTEEEAARLKSTGLNVMQGYTDALPLPDLFASVIVCNSVLAIVPKEKIPVSLREIARIAKPGARIWLGEIPDRLENADVPRYERISKMLGWLLCNRGLRTFLGMCRRLLMASMGRETIILNAAPQIEFHARPDEFIQLAKAAGLTLVHQTTHQYTDQRDKVIVSDSRFDYVFTV